jgi:hypothetical protein
VDQPSLRVKLAIGLAIFTVGIAAVVTLVRPLHAAAQNINPCGTLWTDNAADDAYASSPAGTFPQLDIVSGNMSDDGTFLTTTLIMKSLSTAAGNSPGTANEYTMVWTFNGTSYFTNVEQPANPPGGAATFHYGTFANGTFTDGAAAVTGTFNTGTATVTVSVHLSDVGGPLAGAAFPKSGISGQTFALTGTPPGTPVITATFRSGAETDASAYDYEVGQSCGGPTPTPTPTVTATATPTTTASSACPVYSPEQNISQNGFICPVELAHSSGLGEPTLIHDSGAGNTAANIPRLFVQAPQAIGNGTSGGSPLFTSLDGGLHWSTPVQSTFCTVASGGDTDLATDSNDNVYSTDLWLGNSCVSVSTDHGGSFAFGSPYGSHIQPGDDRPWIAYSKSLNENFFTYDGATSIRVANTAPITTPQLGVQAVNDNVVIPEVAVNSPSIPDNVRACVCPPGGIAIDNTTDAHAGRVYVTYSHQRGEAISYSDPGTGGATTWTQALINDVPAGASAFQDEWNFSPVKVDDNGTVYVMWAHALTFASNLAGSGGVEEYYSFSKDGGATWHAPILLSTVPGTTTFPTMDIAANGTLDTAWYGTSATGDPNSVASGATWNIYYARINNADTNSPSFTPVVAVQDMHNGCIQTGGGKSCADRSLLDFFQITSDPGNPDIIYDSGDSTNGVNIWFTKRVQQPCQGCIPETPLTALLVLPAAASVAGVVMFAMRRRRRGAPQVI